MQAIGLIVRPVRGKIGEIAVLEKNRLGVCRGVALRKICGHSPVDGCLVEIKVRRPRLATPGDARRKHDVLAVRAEVEFFIAAKGLRRHVGIEVL
jgi:hypothetical protein